MLNNRFLLMLKTGVRFDNCVSICLYGL